MLNADNFAFPSEENKEELNEVQISTLVSTVQSRFIRAVQARTQHESRMIDAYNNFRGLYGKNVQFRKSEKSRIFIKATKTKVLAGYGQVMDVVLGGTRFPIGISPTPVPEGVDDVAHVSPVQASIEEETVGMDLKYDVGYKGDGKELPPGTTFGSKLKDLLGMSKTPKEQMLQPGIGPTPQTPKVRPADESAEKMDKLIQDQLEESDSGTELSNAVFESVLLGTGIIKGPFTYTKCLHKWVKDEATGERIYTPVYTKVPRVEFVSVWDAYPDPNATCKKELTYFIHRHRLNESQMRGLASMPLFKEEEILKCFIQGPNYTKQSYENYVTASPEEGSGRDYSDRYEVLEYWGVMGVREAREMGLDVGNKNDLDEIQINAWVCNGYLLRLVQNPFTPARIPYHIFNYEKNPYSIFGIGIPENMSDSQQMMNGHARMAIDNLALAGGLIFDIDETALVPGQDTEVYNGKIFWRQSGSAGQAVHGIKFPNTAQENMMMFDRFRQIADEEVGIPSYSHGQTGVTGMTRTASGMSMLLGAASLNVKTVIKNLDNQLLKPLGEDFFHWNMQFFEGDLDIKGDLEVKAMGTSSLMQKEVRSQRLTMFLQTAMNQMILPFVNIPYIVEELATSLELDKDKVLNSTEQARAFAEIIGLQNGQANGQGAYSAGEEPPGMGAVSQVSGPGGSLGSTGNGNGNIGTGVAAMPGEDEFSAAA